MFVVDLVDLLTGALAKAHLCPTIRNDGTCDGCFVSEALAKAEEWRPKEKLIRDKIPALVPAGSNMSVRQASIEELPQLLANKLVEEAEEYQNGRQYEELSDVLDVLNEIVPRLSSGDANRMNIHQFGKLALKGGFSDRLVLKLK